MRREFVLSCLVLGLAVAAPAKNVRITWIGQAAFVVQAEDGATVVTDPPAPAVGYVIPETPAEVVTVSHNHGDHNFTQGVRGNFTLVDGRPVTTRTQMTAAGMPFVLIPGYHDAQGGAVTGPNTIVQWIQGGLRFAHFGDFGQEQLTDAQLADLQNLDVLIIPAGGFFTIEAEEAAAIIAQLRPRITILAHYRTPFSAPGAPLAALPAVAGPFGRVVYKPSTVVFDADSLPASPETWVMEPSAPAQMMNAAGFAAGVPVAPASLASIFGTFTGSETAFASERPLPRRLGQTEVFLQGSAVPLLYVSPSQINLQIPSGLGSGQFLVEVKVGGQTVARAPVTVVRRAPGLFTAVNADGRPNSPANPARRGDTMQILGTGQGLFPSLAPDGAAAPATPPALTRSVPEVTLGGRRAVVRLSGLLAGAVGVWQITVTVPGDAPAGPAVPLAVRYGLIISTIPVTIQ